MKRFFQRLLAAVLSLALIAPAMGMAQGIDPATRGLAVQPVGRRICQRWHIPGGLRDYRKPEAAPVQSACLFGQHRHQGVRRRTPQHRQRHVREHHQDHTNSLSNRIGTVFLNSDVPWTGDITNFVQVGWLSGTKAGSGTAATIRRIRNGGTATLTAGQPSVVIPHQSIQAPLSYRAWVLSGGSKVLNVTADAANVTVSVASALGGLTFRSGALPRLPLESEIQRF